jgi:cytochrome c-type biogenesis protein CcmH
MLGVSLPVLALIWVMAGGWLDPAIASAQTTNDGIQHELRIERSLACPQCTDLPLDVCEQDICNDMRAIIRQKVLAGDSDAAIRQYFVQRYGSRVLLAPPQDSTGLLIWLIPFAAIAIGAGLTTAYIRSAKTKGKPVGDPDLGGSVTDGDSIYRVRVEREIRELE